MALAPVKIIGLTQRYRGHGLSTATFFLARSLVDLNIPVFIADLTGRHKRLDYLKTHFALKQLVVWSPPPQHLRDIPALLQQVRAQVTGKAGCILVDVDGTLLESQRQQAANFGIDYLVIATEFTNDGQKDAAMVATYFESLQERNRIGVAFARVRVGQDGAEEIPVETNEGLPVLGMWPADYRLAMSEEYPTGPLLPQQTYQTEVARLAQRLTRLTPLTPR